MTGVAVGDTRPVPAKTCRACGVSGEWPGQPCPDCRPPDTVAAAVVTVENRLEVLARIANESHQQTLVKGRELLEHAIQCGRALLEARQRVDHGWLAWTECHLEMHITTAYRYMRIAEHAEQVRRSKAESIEGAIQVLADLPRRGHGPRGYTDADKADWMKLVDQVGIQRAARVLNVSPSTVWKWTSAKSPDKGAPSKLAKHVPISDEAIDRVAAWLVQRFADNGYFVRVTPEVRQDAEQLLRRAFDEAA